MITYMITSYSAISARNLFYFEPLSSQKTKHLIKKKTTKNTIDGCLTAFKDTIYTVTS